MPPPSQKRVPGEDAVVDGQCPGVVDAAVADVSGEGAVADRQCPGVVDGADVALPFPESVQLLTVSIPALWMPRLFAMDRS